MKLVVDTQYDQEFKLDISRNSENSYVIDWGDGETTKSEEVTSIIVKHTYSEANKEYTVTISGVIKQLRSRLQRNLIEIKQWGEIGLTSLSYGFDFCSNLKEIAKPTKNSFKDVTDFSMCFWQTGITSIPENLFANCPNATSFRGCFMVTKITSIPENLFANCPNATDFSNCFYSTEITSIPYDLFKYCNKARSFEETFGECYKLSNYLPLWDKDYYKDGNNEINKESGRSCYGNCSDEMDTNNVPNDILIIWWVELEPEGMPPET